MDIIVVMHDESQRPYTLTFHKHLHYFFVKVTAPAINEEIALAYLREIADKCEELNVNRLLIERDIPNTLDVDALFFVVRKFLSWIGSCRVAFVNTSHTDIQRRLEFAMSTGNALGADYAAFDNVADAEHWLLDDNIHLTLGADEVSLLDQTVEPSARKPENAT